LAFDSRGGALIDPPNRSKQDVLSIRPEIDILMATFNGSRFIEEQLDSLFCQAFQNFRLIVRDDGSSDSTLEIVEKYRSRHPNRVIVRKNPSRLGPCRNFSLLAEESTAPYFAFSDQDDIWRVDKLELELAAAKSIEAKHGIPTAVLVFSDMELVGDDNQLLAHSVWKMKRVNPHRARLGSMLVQNLVTGCTVLGNRSLLLHGLPIPEEAFMHDFWLGLVAAAFGKLAPLDATTVRYRQHENNAMGAGSGLRMADACKRLRGDPSFKQGIERSRRQAERFSERYSSQLSREQKEVLQAWSKSQNLPAGIRHWTLYRNGLLRTSFLNNLGFLARV
jgi:glycosyltransferase involved in cell wall biosynthesis